MVLDLVALQVTISYPLLHPSESDSETARVLPAVVAPVNKRDHQGIYSRYGWMDELPAQLERRASDSILYIIHDSRNLLDGWVYALSGQ
jgi:hypothetical protein